MSRLRLGSAAKLPSAGSGAWSLFVTQILALGAEFDASNSVGLV